MIARNKDGQQKLRDLRTALAARTDLQVHSQGGQWIISRTSSEVDYWYVTPSPYWCDERAALQLALFGEVESKDEARFAAK